MPRRPLLLIALLALAALTWLDLPQALARASLDAALTEAFSAFAIAKGLNATISVLQSSTLDFQVFQLSVGEALDPANDMIERFSWVMFAASGSLALQKLLLGISSSALIKGLMSLTCLAAAAVVALDAERWRRAALKALLACAFLRFAVVAVALASGLAEQAFLEAPRSATMAELERSREHLEALAEERIAQGEEPEKGWWAGLSEGLDRLVTNPVDGMTERFDAITDRVIELTMIFITQTMLFPLGFLYLLHRLASGLTGRQRLIAHAENR